jgi:hypothetical protein
MGGGKKKEEKRIQEISQTSFQKALINSRASDIFGEWVLSSPKKGPYILFPLLLETWRTLL